MVASILIFTAFWNSRTNTWWTKRTEPIRIAIAMKSGNRTPKIGLHPASQTKAAGFLDSCETVKKTITWVEAQKHSESSLKAVLEELEKNRIGGIHRVSVPFLGIHFDVNDLGAFSAIALAIISFTLAFSMARQHDNLYLCLWKIRRIADLEENPGDGQSKANFLYHALAMAQVFTRPPTLARWKPKRVGPLSVRGLLLLPVLVQGTVWINDLKTIHYAWTMLPLATVVSMSVQSLLFFVILICSVASCCYTRADDRRWRRTFFEINPHFGRINQPSWSEWVKLARIPRWNLFATENRLYIGEIAGTAGHRNRDGRLWAMEACEGRVSTPHKLPGLEALPQGMWEVRDQNGDIYAIEPTRDEWVWEIFIRRQGAERRKVARFRGSRVLPMAIPVPPHGICFVDGGCIRKVIADGTTQVLGGDPFGGGRRSAHPRLLGLAMDTDKIFVADFERSSMSAVNLTGDQVPTVYKARGCWSPCGIAVLQERLFLLEMRPVSLMGTLLALAGLQARLLRLGNNGTPEVLVTWWNSRNPTVVRSLPA